ncbi:lytic transglycosylase domain-containing protein [Microvirga thermotolerans]|uniref:Transglycosylase SLT domain-containing protein n=1 Tax=Microvirga thermotolerans TaxID=2651334 RepID=A0A5P9K1X2_9HYPH|nr:lytic transglycosylase domain-containing protein [Microvirga thermotolerans]QFU16184.1 transglycosylase SLT domain-containing protein [Microvirga thermotolerans]
MSLKTRLLGRLTASAALVLLSCPAALAAPPPEGPPRPAADARVPADPETTGSVDGYAYVPPIAPLRDRDYLPLIFKAFRTGDWTEAQILETKLTEPSSVALAEWFALRSGIPMGFERIMSFQRTYPDWPQTAQFRRRAEEALVAERRPAAQVRAFFAQQKPMTAGGRISLAFALKGDGQEAEANALIRQVWREDSFGSEWEGRILDRFPGALQQVDHRYRMERLLFKETWGAALRAAGYAGKDYETLVKARMGVYQGKRKAEKAFAAVPASLRKDPSYLFSRALYLRRANKLAEAAAVMAQAPRDPELLVDGDEWWNERRLVARALLDKGDARTAYQVSSQAAPESPAQRIEAAFHAGWIALRFLKEPATAAEHFAAAEKVATTPISISRIAYWRARAAEAAGSFREAQLHYERAADRPTTYYGQLARSKLGQTIALRTVAPLAEEERQTFEGLTPIQALKALQDLDEPELTLRLYTELAQTLDDPGRLDALASLANARNNARAVLIVGKLASQRGIPLDMHAYPLAAVPDFDPVGEEVEPAMVYAIARQESAFNPQAVSSAGARGLMQLMPATAKETARRVGLGFDLNRLVTDPAYNAKLGSAHLGELMDDWKGSHILAFASYNAGGGNVKKWIKAYGDPRDPEVDPVDWVERIPFSETRNYVQRVLENLNVYRQRLRHPSPPAPATAGTDLTAEATRPVN